MAVQRLKFKNFSGGLADDDTLGPPNSAADLTSIDIRRSPARLQLKQTLTTEASGSGFKGPRSYDAARINDGTMYFANGAFTYKRTPGSNGAIGSYAEETSGGLSIPSSDLDYRPDLDRLFLFTSNSIHELSPLSNSPTYKLNKYSYYSFLEQATRGDTTNLSNTLIEGNKIAFTCTKEPLNRICFMVSNRGTGTDDWTVVVHDAADTVVCSQTIASANVPVVGDVITFDSFLGSTRLNIGADYHIHLTDGNGTAQIISSANNDLSTATVFVYAERLVATSAFVGHTTLQIGAKTYFCNERYVGEWEFLDLSGGNAFSGYDPHRLVLPANFIAVGMAQYSEYLVTAFAIPDNVETTSGGGNAGHGMLIFWDLASDTFRFIVDIPQGVPEGLHSYKNRLYFIARGRLYYWAGGTMTTNSDVNEVYEFPGADEFTPAAAGDSPKIDTYLSAARHCMAVHEGLLKVGYPFQTANIKLKIGVYSFGANKAGLPEAIGFDYVSCNGHTVTAFNTATTPDTPASGISLLTAHSNTLLVAWTHGLGANAGIDRVNETSLYAASGSWRSLWFDNNDPDIEKTPAVLKVTFEPLPAGCTVTPFVQYDHSGTDFTPNDAAGNPIHAIAGDVDVVIPLQQEDGFYQVQVGVTLASASGNNIRITSVTFKFDDNRDNEQATENRRNVS